MHINIRTRQEFHMRVQEIMYIERTEVTSIGGTQGVYQLEYNK